MTESKARRHGERPKVSKAASLGVYTLGVRRRLVTTGLDERWRWPNAKYRDDPVGFCLETLGLPVWDRQQELLEAVRDYPRVAVVAGRKVSKSLTDAVVALWWYCCWDDAKVIMTSTTARQVDAVLWEEVRKLHYRSQHDLSLEGFDKETDVPIQWPTSTRALDGEPLFLARSGLSSGFRSVVGFTAREGVAAAGVSGAHQLWIIDESSGVAQPIIDAIVGNMAGGGRLLLSGNPTTDEGELYDAFHSKRRSEENPTGYYALRISSEESPNVRAGKTVIPGMAERDWIDQRQREWGKDSAQYQIHVEGNFVTIETGKIIPLQVIKEAQERWHAGTEAEGVLHIGIDPALAVSGDEAVFIARRGMRVIDIRAERGLSEKGHVKVLDEMVREHRLPSEVAVVNLDALGEVGAKVKVELMLYWREHEGRIVLCCIRGSDAAQRDPVGYVRMRDELWGSLEQWLRGGGAIPEHAKLERDLHAPSWVPGDLKQRKIATKKDVLRKLLGRSPDHGDALTLACWENTKMAKWAATTVSSVEPKKVDRLAEPAAMGIDPYAGVDAWGWREA